MRKKIIFKDQAKNDLRLIDRLRAYQILQALDRFSLTGEGDLKRLQDIEPPEYRLRVGDYRLRFYQEAESLLVLAVDHRGDAYR